MDSSKKVFLSYRRKLSVHLTARIREQLTARGYDVFLDIDSIPSGKFGEIILRQIEARPLFVPVLVPSCFARMVKKDDWFRREIEHALEKNRHIVPLKSEEFSFDTERKKLKAAEPPCVRELEDYQSITVHDDYFEEAIEKLVKGLSAVPEDVVVRPTPPAEKKVVAALSKAAKVATPDERGTSWVLPSSSIRSLTIPLSAPKLKLTSDNSLLPKRLTWTAVDDASGYVLEKSADSTFVLSAKAYNGNETEHAAKHPFLKDVTQYYRVKAKGAGIWTDSPWSNVVEVGATPSPFELKRPALLQKADDDPKPFGILKYDILGFDALPAPTLSASKTLKGRRLSWTAVEKAHRYVLEGDFTAAFLSPRELYSGKDTSFEDLPLVLVKNYYRVRAIRLGTDSPWSNIVEMD